MDTKDEAIRQIEKECFSIMYKKNQDYGDNISRHGAEGVIIRLWDKLYRLDNVFHSGTREVIDETLEDTIQDARNYLTILLLLLRNEWQLPWEGQEKVVETQRIQEFKRYATQTDRVLHGLLTGEYPTSCSGHQDCPYNEKNDCGDCILFKEETPSAIPYNPKDGVPYVGTGDYDWKMAEDHCPPHDWAKFSQGGPYVCRLCGIDKERWDRWQRIKERDEDWTLTTGNKGWNMCWGDEEGPCEVE
jgi:hypothetical protein